MAWTQYLCCTAGYELKSRVQCITGRRLLNPPGPGLCSFQSVQSHDGHRNVGTLDPLRPFGFCDPDQAASRIDPKSTVVIPDRAEGLRAGQAIVAAEEGQLTMVEPVEPLRTWDEQRVVRVHERCANTDRALGRTQRRSLQTSIAEVRNGTFTFLSAEPNTAVTVCHQIFLPAEFVILRGLLFNFVTNNAE